MKKCIIFFQCSHYGDLIVWVVAWQWGGLYKGHRVSIRPYGGDAGRTDGRTTTLSGPSATISGAATRGCLHPKRRGWPLMLDPTQQYNCLHSPIHLRHISPHSIIKHYPTLGVSTCVTLGWTIKLPDRPSSDQYGIKEWSTIYQLLVVVRLSNFNHLSGKILTFLFA